MLYILRLLESSIDDTLNEECILKYIYQLKIQIEMLFKM